MGLQCLLHRQHLLSVGNFFYHLIFLLVMPSEKEKGVNTGSALFPSPPDITHRQELPAALRALPGSWRSQPRRAAPHSTGPRRTPAFHLELGRAWSFCSASGPVAARAPG